MANGSDSKEFHQTNSILKWIAGIIAALIVVVAGTHLSNMHSSQQRTQDTLTNHENRLIKTETCLQYMANDISEIKDITKEIRSDQKRRQAKDK